MGTVPVKVTVEPVQKEGGQEWRVLRYFYGKPIHLGDFIEEADAIKCAEECRVRHQRPWGTGPSAGLPLPIRKANERADGPG